MQIVGNTSESLLIEIGGRRSQNMNYLITVRFEHETIEITHEGSLSSALKAAWAECKERKAQPAHITCLRQDATIELDEDGWETVSPIARAS
ncbi:hypothetical protein K0U83_12660 [bacterium]|nr:hypothetical protein [bacterium]